MGQAPRNKPKRLGEKLLQIREALGLSQKEIAKRLAERTGFTITQTYVFELRTGSCGTVFRNYPCLCAPCECRDEWDRG
jgi:hypothetical protein